MASKITLPDTSLCAIVRDEKMNPAGGVVDFLESTVPFVEEAVIVDTGSIDGTREILEELSSKYANLQIYDRRFDGFDLSRNYSLSKARTKIVLVLDADERLTAGDFKMLAEKMGRENTGGYTFSWLGVYQDSETESACSNPVRLFDKNGASYYSHMPGLLYFPGKSLPSGIMIKHFYPSVDAAMRKDMEWYGQFELDEPVGEHTPPSKTPSFDLWKQFNPRRELFR